MEFIAFKVVHCIYLLFIVINLYLTLDLYQQ